MSQSLPILQYSVPCLDIDQEHGAPGFQNIFFAFPGHVFPAQLSFCIANGWIGAAGTFVQGLRILAPDGSIHLELDDLEFELRDELTPRMILNFISDAVFVQHGTYLVQVLLNGSVCMEYPVVANPEP